MRLLNSVKVLTLSTVSMLSLSGYALACASALAFIHPMNTGVYTRLRATGQARSRRLHAAEGDNHKNTSQTNGIEQPDIKVGECGVVRCSRGSGRGADYLPPSKRGAVHAYFWVGYQGHRGTLTVSSKVVAHPSTGKLNLPRAIGFPQEA